MSKNAYFLEKTGKIAAALKAPPSNPYWLLAALPLDPRVIAPGSPQSQTC